MRHPHRLGWLPLGATILAVGACYGTTLALVMLSSLGIAVALDEGAWAGTVSVLALLAVAGIVVGYRSHRALAPAALAAAGAASILWAMFGHYHWMVELAGLAALALAAAWNWRLRTATVKEERTDAGRYA